MKIAILLTLSFLASISMPFKEIAAMEGALLQEDLGGINLPNAEKERENNLGEKEETQECAICLDEIKKGAKATLIPCKHMLHVHCLGRLFVSNANAVCPLCRAKITNINTFCLPNFQTKSNKKEIRSLNLFLSDKWHQGHQLQNVFNHDRPAEEEKEMGIQQRNAKFNKRVTKLAKLLPQEFGAGLLNGFIARTLFESDILTDMPSQTAGGVGMLLLFAGSNGLLNLINPQRKNHLAKIIVSWVAGLAIGGYVIPNRLKNYVEKVKAESCLR
jgi:hypothetical protein